MSRDNMEELQEDIQALENAKSEVLTKAMAFTMQIAEYGCSEECLAQAKAIAAEWDAYEYQQRQTLLS